MLELAPGWTIDMERGPDWLIVKLHGPEDGAAEGTNLAERLWSILAQQFTYRLILELDALPVLRSYVVGQLVLLHKRIHAHQGLLRVCGLSEANQAALRACRLDACFPQYRDRHEALMVFRPLQPR
jgi:anti-anti-sigma factor